MKKALLSHGKWIEDAGGAQYASPVFSVSFECAKPLKKAEIYISGLGFYVLLLNGERTDDSLLSPAFSKYDDTVYYNAIDISKKLREGKNTVEVMLGGGWFCEPCEDSFDFEHAAWKHRPMLFCEIYVDGTLVEQSGVHWLCGDGNITFSSVRAGEDCDFRKPRATLDRRAVISKGPGGVLKAQIAPTIRVQKRISPKKLPEGVFDFGMNIAGDVELELSGMSGETVNVIYGERLGSDGHIDQTMIKRHKTIPRTQTDRLIMSGKTELWHSDFSYKGFRYAEIIGECKIESIEARVFYTEFEETGSFSCSDDDLNRLNFAVRNSTRTNFAGIPTDCPHREKNGWTGDAHVSCEQALFNFDMKTGYIGYLDALCDCQRPDGELPCIAPTSVYGYNFQSGPSWDAALIMIPWQIYLYYGDKDVLLRYYKNMKLYADYTEKITENGICESGLGDFLPLDGRTVCPDGMMLSLMLMKALKTLAKISVILGDCGYAGLLTSRVQEIACAAKNKYVGNCERTSSYLTALLYFGLSDDPQNDVKALDSLVRARNCVSGDGLFTSVYLLDALTNGDCFDTALETVKNRRMPGWLYMLNDGGCSLWEHWDGKTGSLNHHMRSPVASWMYRTLAGINIDENHPGFEKVIISPHFTDKISFLSARHISPRGILEVNYDKERFSLTLPQGSTADIIIGGKNIRTDKSIVISRTV